MSIKEEALAHYDRMIKWAEKQSNYIHPHYSTMNSELGEGWTSVDCSYCQEYSYDCEHNCPLYISTSSYFGCCNGLWRLLNKVNTWQEWAEAAKAVRAYIKEHGGSL